MSSGTGSSPRRGVRRSGVHAAGDSIAVRDVIGSLVLATVLAVSQPVLDLLGRNPEFFVNRQAPPSDIVALALLLAVVLPALLSAVVLVLMRISPRAGLVAHGLLLAGLVMAMVRQVTDGAPLPALLKVALALLAAGVVVALFHRVAAVRTVLRWGLAVPLLVVGMFLAASPVSSLVFPAQADEATGGRAADPMPVVMVVLDALPVGALVEPDGTIDEDLYPNFARLAEQSTWFRNATTPHSWTSQVTPALLTGRPQTADREPTAAAYPRNLFTLADGLGYDVHAEETVSWLCPTDVCPANELDVAETLGGRLVDLLDDVRVVALHVLLPDPLRRDLPPIDQGWGDFAEMAGGREEEGLHLPDVTFEDWLATLEPDARALYYYHMWQPHYPYEWLPEGYHYHDPRDTPGGPGHGDKRWHEDDWFLAQAYSRMMLQVGYADRQVGLLLDALERSGLDEEALVLVMSDHGVAFTPGGLLRHATEDNLLEIAHVPLFIRAPGEPAGAVDDRPVSLLDVVPSIADRLGVEDLWDVDGRSVFGEIPEDRVRRLRTAETYDLPSDRRGVEAAVDRKVDWFGTEDGWHRLFRFGPHGDLVGQATAALPVSTNATARARIDDAEAYEDVDLDGESLPALLTGRLSGLDDTGDAVYLAVAVNGEVVATGKSFDHQGPEARFAAMLPASAFRDGRNEVGLYLIDDSQDRAVLRPLRSD